MFIRGRWVHSGSPCGPQGSTAIIWFTRFHPWGRWVNPVWLGSHVFALEDAGYIRGSCVHPSSLCGCMGSSGVIGFSRVHAGGRRGYPGSLGSLGFTLGWLGSPGSLGSPRFALESLGTSGVVGFTCVHPWVRPGCSCVHPASLGLLGFALRLVRFIRVRWVHLSLPWVCLGLSRVVRFTRVLVVGFIRGRWVHLGLPWGSLGSSWVVGFTQVRYCGRWGHPGSLDSLRLTLGVVWFILGRWVH